MMEEAKVLIDFNCMNK